MSLKILGILLLFAAVCFGQTEEQPEARKISEFEASPDGYVKMLIDSFYLELGNQPNAQGVIINYGTYREIALREKQIQKALTFRKYDGSRLTIVRGGFWKNVKSEFWIVPPGAEKPVPDSTARKIDGFVKANDEDLAARLDAFTLVLLQTPDTQGIILSFGSAKINVATQNRIRKYLLQRKFDLKKITFKSGGIDQKGRTEFWLIPPVSANKQ